MTFEGFDAAPLIEATGFSATLAEVPEPEAATLDATLREAARAERAAERAEATMLDLWLHRPGGANLSVLERPALGAQTSWHALAALGGDGGGVLDLGGGKGVPLFAALNDDEEIVVVGPRPNEVDEDDEGGSWGYGGGSYPGGPTGPDVGEGGGGALDSEANDPPDVTTQVVNEANRQEVEEAKIELEKEVARLTPLIAALADNAVVTFKDGTSLTGAELKALWARIDYVVTDRPFPLGAAGELKGDVSYIHMTAALGWDAHVNGLAFILMHEVVHLSPEGQAFYLSLWQQHLAAGGTQATWPSSSLFGTNEQFANFGARAIDDALGIPAMTTTPTHGY